MNITIQYAISGTTADEISASIEEAVRGETLEPGDALPTVRGLAEQLGVSPTTVAASYRELTRRGIIVGEGRRGTKVRSAPPVSGRLPIAVPSGVLDLRTGGPDPHLLPVLPPLLGPGKANRRNRRSYGEEPMLAALAQVAKDRFSSEGVDATNLAVVSGALDGVERVLGAWLRPGDRVAVEDPAYTAMLDLLAALSLRPVPVEMDDLGVRPALLEAALARGARAAFLTPRAQNPTGAAWDERRAAELRDVFGKYPDVLVVEDDHAGPAAGVELQTLGGATNSWATIRSVSKWLGPDLRVAVVAGDATTVGRVEGRQALGTGWVSYFLQEMVATMWSDPATTRLLEKASLVYAARRSALVEALRQEGIVTKPRSGLTLWVPVTDEHAVVEGLFEQGIAISPGERFSLSSRQGVRIAFAALEEHEAPAVATAFGRVLRQRYVRTG